MMREAIENCAGDPAPVFGFGMLRIVQVEAGTVITCPVSGTRLAVTEHGFVSSGDSIYLTSANYNVLKGRLDA